jgi:phosphate transport system protein
MPRIEYERQLADLDAKVQAMGAHVKELYEKAYEATGTGRLEEGWSVDAAQSDNAAAAERAIESLCLRILLRQQPVAGDLREVSGALKMVTDLKRVSDLSADVCRIVSELEGRVCDIQRSDLLDMGALVAEMLDCAVRSYLAGDLKLAHRAIAMDDEADVYYEKIREKIIQGMLDKQTKAQDAVNLLMIAKYYERIGDHAEIVARWAEYTVNGTREDEPPTGVGL